MTERSVAGSAEVEVYAYWALIMVRMTYALVGADRWTIAQNKVHPAVAEEISGTEGTIVSRISPASLDLSCMSRIKGRGLRATFWWRPCACTGEIDGSR